MSKEDLKEQNYNQELERNIAVEYNTHLAYFDIKNDMFLVDFQNKVIPLNVFIQFIIQATGEFIPMGMSYNPGCGKQRQELAFMYKVPASRNFNQFLDQLIKVQKN